jgi:integral membrane protein
VTAITGHTGGMPFVIDVSTPASRFRLVAILEAISWAGLLTAMFFKYALHNEAAMMTMGMIHGTVFVAYVVLTLLASRPLAWNLKVLAVALVASIPPFGSVVFERWAAAHGQLGELSVVERAVEASR